MTGKTAISAIIAQKTMNHPCFHCGASNNARIHLPVAPNCNIQCNYCVRKFDCVNESRPGVASAVLTPDEAVSRYRDAKSKVSNLAVVGIAGPGDALANFDVVRQTLRSIRRLDPDVTFCLSTNGLMLPFYADELIALGVTHMTVTLNTVEPKTGAKIYKHISYLGHVYTGEEGASILLRNQLSGIRYLVSTGLVVKVNIVLMKGINDHEIMDVVTQARECGCAVTNIMPLIPLSGSAFKQIEPIGGSLLYKIRKEAEGILPQIYHCKQCRADAIGTLNKDVLPQYSRSTFDRNIEDAPARKKPSRFAACTKDGKLINQHFGHTTVFYIYDIAMGKPVLVEKRPVKKYCNGPAEGEHDGRLNKLVQIIADCDCVLCMRIGAHPYRMLQENGISVVATYNRIEPALMEAARKMEIGKSEGEPAVISRRKGGSDETALSAARAV